MPSKVNHEIDKLRGESEDTGEKFTSDMASLQDAIDKTDLDVRALESENKNLSSKYKIHTSLISKIKTLASNTIKHHGHAYINKLNFDEPTTLVIDGAGAITVTQSYHLVDTNGGAATDNLDQIKGGTQDGEIVILRQLNGARDVTIRHFQHNIVLKSGGDYVFGDGNNGILLIFIGGNWINLS